MKTKEKILAAALIISMICVLFNPAALINAIIAFLKDEPIQENYFIYIMGGIHLVSVVVFGIAGLITPTGKASYNHKESRLWNRVEFDGNIFTPILILYVIIGVILLAYKFAFILKVIISLVFWFVILRGLGSLLWDFFSKHINRK